MWISRYVCLFLVYCFLGWIYETTFCTFKNGKWSNRGFLYGPICPIYGVGAVLISVIYNHFFGVGEMESSTVYVFVVSVIGSAILEYVTATVLEKMFHAVWWDYSKLPFNIKGRVSLFTSLGFGCGGILVVNYIAPAVESKVDLVSPIWMEGLSIVGVAIFAMDFTLTVSALVNLQRILNTMEANFNERMENFVESAKETTQNAKERFNMDNYNINMDEWKARLSNFQKSAIQRASAYRYKSMRTARLRELITEKVKKEKK